MLTVADVGNNRGVFFFRRTIDLVVAILADHRQVGWDNDGFQAIDLLELIGFRIGRTGHAGKLAVHAEIVLEGDRGQRLVFILNRHAFLGLDSLVQPFRPAAAGHQASREFIDDDDLAILNNIVLIAQKEIMGTQRRI